MSGGIRGWIERRIPSKPLRALFIGNSLTYLESPTPDGPLVLNDLPGLLARMSRSRGERRSLIAGRLTENSATLEEHLHGGRVESELRPGAWDYVVLQENSERACSDDGAMRRDFLRLDELIKAAGARTALFSIGSAQSNEALSRVHGELSDRTGALLVPAARAWFEAARARPKSTLLMPDGVHPGPLGAYLNACVFFAALYGKSPETSDAVAVADDAEAVGTLRGAQSRFAGGGGGGSVSEDDSSFLRALAWRSASGGPGVSPAVG